MFDVSKCVVISLCVAVETKKEWLSLRMLMADRLQTKPSAPAMVILIYNWSFQVVFIIEYHMDLKTMNISPQFEILKLVTDQFFEIYN